MIPRLFLLLLVFTPVSASILCPYGYQAGYFGCYYFKTIQSPQPLINPTCDHPKDRVLAIPKEKFYAIKGMFDVIFGGNTSIENGYVVLRNGTQVTYLCYTEMGIYNKGYTVRSIIKEHVQEFNELVQYTPLFSLQVGLSLIAYISGRFLGVGIANLAFISIIALLDLAGYMTVPWEVYAISAIIPTAISLAFIFTILLERRLQ